jgi:hypothetical protein
MRRLLPLLLLLAACEPRSRKVVIQNDVDPSAKDVEIFVMGDPLAKASGPELSFVAPTWHKGGKFDSREHVLSGHRADGGTGAMPDFTARFQEPCGPVDYCVRFGFESGQPMPPRSKPVTGRLLGRKRARFDVCTDVAHLWIDNRGGPAHRLTIGSSQSLSIAAGESGERLFTLPACASQSRVAIDGETVGTFPVLADDLEYRAYDEPGTWFLDAKGGRCWSSTTYEYSSSSSFGNGPQGRRFQDGRLYSVDGEITDFLKEAPESIQTYNGGFGSRTDLVETPCTPP